MDKIFFSQASLPKFEEYTNEIKDIWNTHWVTSMGPKHNFFEEELKKFLEVKGTSVFVNGHSALEAVISVMRLKGEVITTPFTFVSTTHAIVRNGLRPIFCDVSKKDFNIDVNRIEELITDKTTAIIPVHVFGSPCDVETIEIIAKKNNLKVIYDAAHAFGVRYNGKSIAKYGDASVFSFHASKVFNSIEGGCVAYDDLELEEIFYKFRNFGISSQNVEYIGANGKMNEFVAAMGVCNLRHIEEMIKKRRELVKHYVLRLKGVQGLNVMFKLDDADLDRNYAYMPILIDDGLCKTRRDKVWMDLNRNGIQAMRYFYPTTNQLLCYEGMLDTRPTPNAKWISEHILLLPLYEDLLVEQVDYICDYIIQSMKKNL